MLWRYKWTLLHTTQMTQILKTRSIRRITSPPTSSFSVTEKTHDLFSRENRKFSLTPQVVHSTLLNCPSDLISLSFFMWCAKQRDYFHDNNAFDHMVGVVTRLNRRYRSVEGVVRGLQGIGVAIKAQTLLLLLRIYWRGGMYSMVFEVFEAMNCFSVMPNTFARNVLMDVLFKMGRVDLGMGVLKGTRLPNFLSFSIALCNLCRLNDLVGVKYVMQMMLREGYYPNAETFEMALNCFCKVGRLVEAYQVLGLMTTLGISLSVNSWTILINGFCQLHQPGMAGHLLEMMVQSGCSPNIVTYTTIFKGYIESEMTTRAFDILRTMETKGYAPDLVLCNVLIDSLSKMGSYDDALDVFQDFSRWKLVPDSFTFSSLLSTISNSRRFGLLPKLVNELLVKADLVVCNSFLNYFCKAGFPCLALQLYDDMIDKGFRPDKYTFVGLLRGLCKLRRTDEAVNVYRGIVIKNPSLDAHVHTIIIDGLTKSGECHKAIRLFRKAVAENYPLDVVSYTVAICGLLKGGRTTEASTLYDQMKEVGLIPNARTYSVMLHGFSKARDINMVKKLLQEISEAAIQLDCSVLIKLSNFLLKYHLSSSSINHLQALWNLALQSDDEMNALLFNQLVHSKGYVKDNFSLDSSSSEELFDVAASVG